jgi:hypothetical protein
MKTFRQYVIGQMLENGMSVATANTAMALIERDTSMESMKGRWGDDVSDYPDKLAWTTYLLAKPVIAKYLEENLPHAWFRPHFADGFETATDPDRFVSEFWEKNRKPIPDEELDKVLDAGVLSPQGAQAVLTVLKARVTAPGTASGFVFDPDFTKGFEFDPTEADLKTPDPLNPCANVELSSYDPNKIKGHIEDYLKGVAESAAKGIDIEILPSDDPTKVDIKITAQPGVNPALDEFIRQESAKKDE